MSPAQEKSWLRARFTTSANDNENHSWRLIAEALTESLLESELFGHVKGAFTGARGYKKGMFESAGNGTIFFDEFGEMSSSMQVRLLRVLQEHKVRPVGSDSTEINFNARVVVATNRDLRREVTEGRFRQDLYYRVNVFSIRSPALRDRLDDLPLLIDVLLNRLIDRSKLVRPLRFDSEALALIGELLMAWKRQRAGKRDGAIGYRSSMHWYRIPRGRQLCS